MSLSGTWITIEYYIAVLLYEFQRFKPGQQFPYRLGQLVAVELLQVLYL